MPWNEITNNEEKEIEKELKNFDASFGLIFDEINRMEWKEKREIYIQYYSNIFKELNLIVNSLFKDYSNRNDLNNLDFLLYNYIKLLLSLTRDAMELLQESNKNNLNKNLFLQNYVLLYFLLPLYNYNSDTVKEDELINKISEFASIVVIDHHTVPKNVRDLLNISKDIQLYKLYQINIFWA